MIQGEDLTILLAVKDRVPFTQRWLEYARAHLPFRVLIADGGSDDAVERIVSEPACASSHINYVRYPFDASYADYYGKLADALSRVTTPFVVMADNDDFFIPAGLTRALQFLATHSDHVACGGQCALFWVAGESPAADTRFGDSVAWKCSSLLSSDVADTAERRLRERSLGANDVFYAVHRTALLRDHFAAVRDCSPHDLFLMEELVMFLTAIAGKTCQLETLYIARQQDSPGSSAGAHEARFGDWYDRMLVPTWSGDFTRFVAIAAAALSRADGVSADQARQAIVESYKMSVAPFLLADVLDEPSVSFSTPLVQQVVRRLVKLPRTSVVRRVAQRLYRRTQWLSHDFVHGTEFRTRRARQAAREFTPVREFLENPGRYDSSTAGT
ncbi:MAG TPA: TIGR00180 family glycosyltransferase [Vicinamibacterales bacterium]|nr:TIGR00180 family glycosyltransferase [Vicinamibacterales bacterium]